tara:strand:+ start:581 stop:1090 length:510 start_codon:yes stop_codon:yes gene_type:complete
MKSDQVTRIIEDELNDLSLPFFWGGSRRWGFNSFLSDYDIFVLGGKYEEGVYSFNYILPEGLDLNLVRASRFTDQDSIYPLGSTHFETTLFNRDIDMLFFEDSNRRSFEELRLEHEQVDLYCQSHQLIISLIARIKHKMTSKEAYQALVDAMNTEKRKERSASITKKGK